MEPETLGQVKLGETNNTNPTNPTELVMIEAGSDGTDAVGRIPPDAGRIPTDAGNKLGGALYGPLDLGVGGSADMRLVKRAANERWPIPARVRENVAVWMADVAENARDRRARVNAVKVLAELDKLNMEAEKVERSGDVQRVDITSGGKPLVPDAGKLSDAELAERIRALEGG